MSTLPAVQTPARAVTAALAGALGVVVGFLGPAWRALGFGAVVALGARL